MNVLFQSAENSESTNIWWWRW